MALQGMYHPRSIGDALALLAQDPEAKLMSGGATLVAMMNARVLEPRALVSLARIEEIKGITTLPDGRVRIGAFTRHCETSACELLAGTAAVVGRASGQIASAAVRNMGTIGGSIAFADPAIDYPPALVAAEAVVEIASAEEIRTVPAAEFFVDWYTTALQPGEIVTAVILPKPEDGTGLYLKHSRVAGDYAIVSVAISRRRDGRMRLAVGSCGPTPLADAEADAILSTHCDDAAVARAGALLQARADPLDDVRGTAEYRRMVIPRMVARAVHSIQAHDRGAA
jgi:aerobic carbon-monoxide dehydrogenase medium subunit